MSGLVAWLRSHDPGYVALRRAGRTALILPALFAVGDKLLDNSNIAFFAAFGSIAMLLLVDFTGPMRDRVLDQAALGVACALLIALGTLVSRTTWVAALAMAVVAFTILFASVVSSVLAGATTSLLLAFILPVSLPGSAAAIPDRVAGWGMAAAASVLAIALLWPAPARNPVRASAIDACRALAARLRAEIAWIRGGRGADETRAHDAATARAGAAMQSMLNAFFATPYRPGGLSTDGRAMVQLVDELRWLDRIVERAATAGPSPPRMPGAGAVKLAVADVLERAADRLESPDGGGAALTAAIEAMHGSLHELEHATMALSAGADHHGGDGAHAVVSALDPSFRAQELSFIAARIAANADFAAAATRRSWGDRLLGHQPGEFERPLDAARRRASAHWVWTSLALHNSLRGASALTASVLVADLSSVQHGFWVIFGTLAVLRSNALSTGQSVLRAVLGTTIGFVVGGVIVAVIGTNTAVLWVLLPIAILFAGLAPTAISFVAGQAGFTVTLLILFNLMEPAGWRIGLVRVEDVAIGSAVSLVVGLLFWPRGAAAGLSRALADAYDAAARYLADAVAYGVDRCDAARPSSPSPQQQALDAAAATRRLDEAFRGYLGERGSKPATLSEVASLVTGVTGVGLAADSVIDLWDGARPADGDRSAARRELLDAAAHVTGWYDRFATSLLGGAPPPAPLQADQGANGRLLAAVEHDLRDADGDATATGVRVIWTGDHLDAVRRLQASLVTAASEPSRAASRVPA